MADEINIVVRADDLASAAMQGVAIAADGLLSSTNAVRGGFEAFGSIISGVRDAFDMIVGTFENIKDFMSQFVEAAAESETALAGLDIVLASTAASAGITSETFGQLSNVGLLNLEQSLDAAKAKLKEMEDTYPGVKHQTELQSLALEVQREKVANLTNEVEKGKNGWTVFKDTTQLSRDALIDLSKELQNTTIYSDEMVLSAESMMLRFENINANIFPDAIRLSADLASSLGIELPAAARLVGMALDDPEKGIGRLNTAYRIFDDAQMSVIKNMAASGDLAGAQALIMQGLTEKFGGAAVAIGETFAGKLAIAKNALDDFKEAIGAPFMEMLKLVFDKFTDFMHSDTIQNIIKFFEDWAMLIKATGDPLASLGTAMKNFEDLVPIFGDISQVIFLFTTASQNGAGAFNAFGLAVDTFLYAHPDSPLAPWLKGIEDFITKAQSGDWQGAIGDVFAKIWDAIATPGAKDSLQNKLIAMFNGIDWSGITTGTQNLLDKLTIAIQNSPEALAKLATVLGNVFSTAINLVFGIIDLGVLFAGAVARADWSPLGKAILDSIGTSIWNSAEKSGFADTIGKFFFDAITLAFSPLKIAAHMLVIGTNIAAGLILGFANMYGTILTYIGGVVTGIIDEFKALLGIASPSTIFMDIGRNILLGLMLGIGGMLGEMLAYIGAVVTLLLAPFKPILDLLGIDISGLSGGSASTGTVSGGVNTQGPGGSGTASGQVVNNYYGPVYFQGGAEPGSYYDCPSPNPLMTAGTGTLGTHAI